MPAVETAELPRAHPKYPIEVDATLVYRGVNVYVSLAHSAARDQARRHADVRILSKAEGAALESGLPFGPSQPAAAQASARAINVLGPVGLGDAISSVTQRFGIGECHGCKARKRALNRIAVWGWWRAPSEEDQAAW
jgi:hypothetical protein